MEIVIGKQGNQPFPLSESSISRKHAVLIIDNHTGALRLRDNNSTNGTWILTGNGQFKRLMGEAMVNPETSVRLGAKQIIKIKDVMPAPVDISNLKDVYETYNNNKLILEAKISNILMLRMAAMTVGVTLAGLFFTVLPEDILVDKKVTDILKGIVSIVTLGIAWIIVDHKNRALIRKKSQNEAFLKRMYCCPKCGFHFGPKLYSNLIAEGRCPNSNCRCKFTGE